jgi:predicted aspartyl protease
VRGGDAGGGRSREKWLCISYTSLITLDVALELDLDTQAPVRQERIASVHRVVSAPVVSLASVQIGAQRLTTVEALVLPLPAELRVDGLLGVNVLEHFRTTFEFLQATIVLR